MPLTSSDSPTPHAPPTPSTSPACAPAPRPRRSLRTPRRARLGDPPLLRRVANELAYTPTRCRVTASLLVARVNPWWQRLPTAHVLPPDMRDVSTDGEKTNAPTGEPVQRVLTARNVTDFGVTAVTGIGA